MGSLIGLIAGRTIFGKTISQDAARLILGALAFVVIMIVLLIAWTMVKHDIIAKHDVQAEQAAKPATDRAAAERAQDTITASQTEQEMHNAIAATPDQPIAPSTRALGCERLRKIGRHPAACG